jgi:DNA-binding response OmpR family regulator
MSDSTRILVIEDDSDFRDLLVVGLAYEGYHSSGARDGFDAIDQLAAARARGRCHDVVVSDIRLPGHDGFTLLETIRKARWGTPVILMSGFNVEDESAAFALGAVGLLSKPFEMTQLVDLIERSICARGVQ